MPLLLLWQPKKAGGAPASAVASGAADPRAFRSKKRRRYVLPDGAVVIASQAEINAIMLRFMDEHAAQAEMAQIAHELETSIRRPTAKEREAIEEWMRFPKEERPVLIGVTPALKLEMDVQGAILGYLEGVAFRRRQREEEEWLITVLH